MLKEDEFNPYYAFTGVTIPIGVAESPDLSPGAKLCYGGLLLYLEENGRAAPGMAKLARSLGMNSKECCIYLMELSRHGFIKIFKWADDAPASFAPADHPALYGDEMMTIESLPACPYKSDREIWDSAHEDARRDGGSRDAV